jgi:hypothetical protein
MWHILLVTDLAVGLSAFIGVHRRLIKAENIQVGEAHYC